MLKSLAKGLVLSLLVMGCAHEKEVAVSSGNVKDRIAEDDQKVVRAYEQQWDVLAQSDLLKSTDHLKSAKKHDADGDSLERTDKELAMFDENYNRAGSLAAARAPKVQGILTARKAVLASGIRQFPDDNKTLTNLDDDFRDLSENKKVDVEDFSKLQTKYMKLSAQMTKNQYLMTAKAQVDDAKKNKAKKHAPRALNQAEVDIKNAENMIEANANDPSSFTPAVNKANRSSAMLAAIVVEQKKVNYNLDESAAQKIVIQDGRLERLNFDLAVTGAALAQSQNSQAMTADQLAQSQSEIDRKNQLLLAAQSDSDAKNKELRAAASEKRFQAALESAQKQFSPSEADVYRQGNKILIRLKTIGFATGKSELPASSKALVDKVAAVAQQLGPQQVVVEGHTDSVGSAEINNQISQQRAETVMSYLSNDGISKDSLQAVGYGFQKPLSSNKTKAGRAQNRRVDIWITPDDMKVTQ